MILFIINDLLLLGRCNVGGTDHSDCPGVGPGVLELGPGGEEGQQGEVLREEVSHHHAAAVQGRLQHVPGLHVQDRERGGAQAEGEAGGGG